MLTLYGVVSGGMSAACLVAAIGGLAVGPDGTACIVGAVFFAFVSGILAAKGDWS